MVTLVPAKSIRDGACAQRHIFVCFSAFILCISARMQIKKASWHFDLSSGCVLKTSAKILVGEGIGLPLKTIFLFIPEAFKLKIILVQITSN